MTQLLKHKYAMVFQGFLYIKGGIGSRSHVWTDFEFLLGEVKELGDEKIRPRVIAAAAPAKEYVGRIPDWRIGFLTKGGKSRGTEYVCMVREEDGMTQ